MASLISSSKTGIVVRDGAVVAGVEGLLELLGEGLALHEVLLRPHLQLVLEQLFQQLGGDVLVLEAAHLGGELQAEGSVKSE